MTRGRKVKPGRVVFVGSGPGDPALLTVRARSVLAGAKLVFTDPDVPADVLALVGVDVAAGCVRQPESRRVETRASAAERLKQPPADENGAEPDEPGEPRVRPALGDPTEVAKLMVGEARGGADVVRLVAGDPLSLDAVTAEVLAVAKTNLDFEIVPGLPASTAVPTYAGLPLGSAHTVADVRGDVDWAALAAAPGPLILHAALEHLSEAARTLIDYGLSDSTLCVVTSQGTTRQQRSVEVTLSTLDRQLCGRRRGSHRARRRAVLDERSAAAKRTTCGHHRPHGREPVQAELVGESRALRLDRTCPAHQGPGR